MHEGKTTIGAARQVAAICIAIVILAIAPLYGAFAAQHGSAKAAPAAGGRGADIAKSPRAGGLARRSRGPGMVEAGGRKKIGGRSRAGFRGKFGLAAYGCPSRRNPRAHCRACRYGSRSPQPVRTRRRPPAGRDPPSGDRRGAGPGIRGAGLRRRVVVSQDDAEDTPARRRSPYGDCQRPPTSRRCALRLCLRRRCGLRHRQRRPIPGARLAAAPTPDGIRLSGRFARHPYRGGRRPFSARPRRRALPHHSDGHGDRPVLVPTAHRVRRLACLWLGHRQRADHAWLLDGRAPARRLRAWPRSPRHGAGIALAPAGRAGPARRSPSGRSTVGARGRIASAEARRTR